MVHSYFVSIDCLNLVSLFLGLIDIFCVCSNLFQVLEGFLGLGDNSKGNIGFGVEVAPRVPHLPITVYLQTNKARDTFFVPHKRG